MFQTKTISQKMLIKNVRVDNMGKQTVGVDRFQIFHLAVTHPKLR